MSFVTRILSTDDCRSGKKKLAENASNGVREPFYARPTKGNATNGENRGRGMFRTERGREPDGAIAFDGVSSTGCAIDGGVGGGNGKKIQTVLYETTKKSPLADRTKIYAPLSGG